MKRKMRTISFSWLTALALSGYLLFAAGGCGQKDAVQASAEMQSSAEPTAGGQSTAADGASTDVESTDENGQISLQDVAVAPDETNAGRAQMEIDEETRRELTAQLLKENHLDTSVVEPKHATRGCTFDLPEGFAESEEVSGMYIKERYPLDASTISYAVMEQDMALQLLDEDAFREQTQESLRQVYGDGVEVGIDSFESIKVSGYPAFRIKCHYQVESINITQLAYIINADKTYAITYSQTSDYDYMEEYEASAATIRVQ